MTSTRDFARSLCLSVDAKGYGSADDLTQRRWQRELLGCLDRAAERANIDRSRWWRQPSGDGELALLPDDGTEPRVVDDLVRELDRDLADYNRGRIDNHRLRLRLALHYGRALPGDNGASGNGVVQVCRLANSKVAHEALEAAPEAHLAVILSKRIYKDVVLQSHTSLRPADFRRVRVVEKELKTDAWLRVPGTDVHRLDLPSARGAQHGDQQGAASEHSVVAQADSNLTQRTDHRYIMNHPKADSMYNFGDVDAPHSHFGPNYGQRGRND